MTTKALNRNDRHHMSIQILNGIINNNTAPSWISGRPLLGFRGVL